LMADGQGIAHPRRFGLAAHLGVLYDVRSVGCAKTRLIGTHDEPGGEVGDRAPLTDAGKTIGAVVRTKRGVKPVYVSPGHRVSLDAAVDLVLRTGAGYRIPEPTRQAHLAVNVVRREHS
jgi:deoxyribonuclease V